MFAALIAVAVADGQAAESAAWVAQLRAQFAAVTSLTAEYTRTETDRFGASRSFAHLLRLARRPSGEWVGDLAVRSVGGRPGVMRYILWGGRVYEADPALKVVREYTPVDNSPLRFAGEHFLPALFLLSDDPTYPRLTAWLTRRDGPYVYRRVEGLLPGSWWSFDGRRPREWAELDYVAVAIDGAEIPRHLPRLIRQVDGTGRQTTFDVKAVRLNPVAGPTPADIADPTVVPAGWKVVSAYTGEPVPRGS